MKKLFATMLALAMLLSLCACGFDVSNEDSVRGEQIKKDPTELETPIDSVTIPEETDDEEFSMGLTSDLAYENSFIGIGFTLPEGWSFYSDEQIREMNNIAIDASGEELQELVANAQIVYDMFASDADGVNNINVNLEKVNPLQLLGLDLLQNLENSVPLIQTSYENMGASLREYKVETIVLDGSEFACLYTTIDFPTVTLYQAVLEIKCNGYLSSVTITSNDAANLSELLELIYVVD